MMKQTILTLGFVLAGFAGASAQHLKEPGCEVKLLLKEGKIKQSRYDDYLAIRTEISEGRIPEYLK